MTPDTNNLQACLQRLEWLSGDLFVTGAKYFRSMLAVQVVCYRMRLTVICVPEGTWCSFSTSLGNWRKHWAYIVLQNIGSQLGFEVDYKFIYTGKNLNCGLFRKGADENILKWEGRDDRNLEKWHNGDFHNLYSAPGITI